MVVIVKINVYHDVVHCKLFHCNVNLSDYESNGSIASFTIIIVGAVVEVNPNVAARGSNLYIHFKHLWGISGTPLGHL